jgi:hypothetical protein
MSIHAILEISTSIVPIEADGDFNASPATTRLSNQHPIEINGGWFHLEAIEVDEAGDAVNPSLQENIDAVWTLCGDQPASTEINGKRYVTVVFPHSH